MSNFHTHTYYSVRDGIQSPKQIAEFQKSTGKDWFCITDHGSMSGHPEAFEAAKETGMKFFAGCEFYVKPDDIFDGKINIDRLGFLNKELKKKTLPDEDRAKYNAEKDEILSRKGHDEWYYHLTVFAFNSKGLINLYNINNNGDFYYKTRARKEDILKYNEGLIVLSGCPAGEFLKMIEYGYEDLAEKWLRELKEVYQDRVYFELMFHDGVYNVDPIEGEEQWEFQNRRIIREKEVYTKGLEIARRVGVKVVGSNDSHYTTPADRRNWLITRKAMIGNDKDFTGDYNLLPDNTHFEEAYPGLVTAAELDESEAEIVARYEPYDMFRSDYHSTKEDKELLERLVWTGFKKKRLGTEYEEESLLQIPYELAVIQTKDFDKYFLSTRDVVKSAFEKGVLVGPGRGSGAGSECVYLIDITATDPLKFGLMFERFLNPGRNAMPDIDLDLCSTACENFKPNEEYKKIFFVDHEELVSDDEIASYWAKYHELKQKTGDTRREGVYQAQNKEYFEGFIGLHM
jgi:DNA polymerase-3 subunit alpha